MKQSNFNICEHGLNSELRGSVNPQKEGGNDPQN